MLVVSVLQRKCPRFGGLTFAFCPASGVSPYFRHECPAVRTRRSPLAPVTLPARHDHALLFPYRARPSATRCPGSAGAGSKSLPAGQMRPDRRISENLGHVWPTAECRVGGAGRPDGHPGPGYRGLAPCP